MSRKNNKIPADAYSSCCLYYIKESGNIFKCGNCKKLLNSYLSYKGYIICRNMAEYLTRCCGTRINYRYNRNKFILVCYSCNKNINNKNQVFNKDILKEYPIEDELFPLDKCFKVKDFNKYYYEPVKNIKRCDAMTYGLRHHWI